MNKIYGIFVVMLLTISGVNADLGSCDVNGDGLISLTDAVYLAEINSWFSNQDLRADLNNDGKVDLTDIGLWATYSQEEGWCYNNMWQYFEEEEEQEEQPQQASSVSRGQSFSHYNLDRRATVEMSRSLPILGFEVIAREIQYRGERYKVGFNGRNVQLYEKYSGEKVNPEGLEVNVEYRTFWSRTITFSKE